MKKTIKKLSAELDDNNKLVDNVGLKLSENNIPLNELGSLKMKKKLLKDLLQEILLDS